MWPMALCGRIRKALVHIRQQKEKDEIPWFSCTRRRRVEPDRGLQRRGSGATRFCQFTDVSGCLCDAHCRRLAGADLLDRGLVQERALARARALSEASLRRSRLLDVEGRDPNDSRALGHHRLVRLVRFTANVLRGPLAQAAYVSARRTSAPRACKRRTRFRRP